MSLRWYSFEKYPEQWSDVYIHCFSDHDEHKFVMIRGFNAVNVNFTRIVQNYPGRIWRFEWFPAEQVDKGWKKIKF